jgi:predicted enzyme related to lactoylglutathione lyase
MAKVLGVGGVFFKAKDPRSLGQWYKKWLGVPAHPEWGASFTADTAPPGGFTVWAPFASDTTYFEPSSNPFMINLMVDDLEDALTQVAEGGAEVVGDVLDEPYGRFGWFIDPEGNKVELWQPKEEEKS